MNLTAAYRTSCRRSRLGWEERKGQDSIENNPAKEKHFNAGFCIASLLPTVCSLNI